LKRKYKIGYDHQSVQSVARKLSCKRTALKRCTKTIIIIIVIIIFVPSPSLGSIDPEGQKQKLTRNMGQSPTLSVAPCPSVCPSRTSHFLETGKP